LLEAFIFNKEEESMSLYRKVLEKMKKINCIQKERGAIFVLTALLLPIMFGCLGIAYDVGNIYIHKARLQNVTDAAALAGGRAYLESQAKTTGTKDSIDDNTSGKAEKTYTIGGSQTLSGNHQDADKAADDYIYKNIINLGETVKSDKYSHYALRGLKKNAVEEGQESANPTYNNTEATEIFYRIGLYETVPLYFLPVITDKNKEIVRAGSVVVVQPGTTTVIPGSGGGSSTITHTSIFDNLFTFSETLFTRNNIDSDGTIHQSFFGDMVYTHRNSLTDGDPTGIFYESSTPGPAGDDDATNTNQNHWYEQMGGTGSSSTVPINDPIIDTTFDTKAYIESFRKKLNGPHVDVSDSPSNKFYVTGNGNIYVKCNTKYQLNGEGTYRKDGNVYYLLDTEGNDATFVENGRTYKICYHELNGQYFLCGKSETDGNYYLLNTNGQISNCYIEVSTTSWGATQELAKVSISGSTYFFGWRDAKLWYGDNQWYQSNELTIDKLTPNVAITTPVSSDKFTEKSTDYGTGTSNIYHVLLHRLSDPNQIHDTIDIVIDQPIEGDENEPVYILIEGINQVHIEGNATTTRRPVILVFLSESTTQIKYEFTGGEFKGVIYAPISNFEHVQNLTGTFRGNIITKNINIEASSKITWIQENYLENNNYTDTDIKAVSDANKEKIEAANAALTAEIRQKLLDRLGVTAEQMDSKDWYEHLRYPEKQSLYTKWKALYEEYKDDPAIRNILWPWNEHFDIESGEDQTVTTDENLRLINFRTENRENDTVVDPFIFETLGEPNSY